MNWTVESAGMLSARLAQLGTTTPREDLDTLMQQMRGYPPSRVAAVVWDWMKAQGFRDAPDLTHGSCWDAAPSVIGHDPMPEHCELTAGHLGAHRSGSTEWMCGTSEPSAEATRDHVCWSLSLRPSQGEPSVAQVEAAAREYRERNNGQGSFDRVADHVRASLIFRMRCALRAAGGAR